MNHRTLDSF